MSDATASDEGLRSGLALRIGLEFIARTEAEHLAGKFGAQAQGQAVQLQAQATQLLAKDAELGALRGRLEAQQRAIDAEAQARASAALSPEFKAARAAVGRKRTPSPK